MEFALFVEISSSTKDLDYHKKNRLFLLVSLQSIIQNYIKHSY